MIDKAFAELKVRSLNYVFSGVIFYNVYDSGDTYTGQEYIMGTIHRASFKVLKKLVASTVVKNFLIYSFGAFFLKGISVLLAPIIMRILTPADYGLLALITSFINIVFTFAGLGLRQFLMIEYFHFDDAGRKKIINDVIFIYCACMLPVFILLFFNSSLINRFVFFNQVSTTLIYLSLSVAFMKFFVELFFQILQYAGQAFTLTLLQVVSALVIVGLNLLFLCVFGWGVFSLVASQYTSVLLILLLFIYFYISQCYYIGVNIVGSVKKSLFYLKGGLPFIPKILFAWVLAVGDRWILARYGTLSDVGIYSVADMFGQLFQMAIIIPISYAYFPHLMSKFAKNKGSRGKLLAVDAWNYRNMFLVMGALFILVSLGFTLLKPLVCIIIPKSYHSALQYVWFLLIGYIFYLGTYFSTGFLHFQKKVYFLVFALLVPAVCNIGLNIFLIPMFAIWGCVIATVFSYVLYFIIILIYNFYLKRC